MSPLDFIAQPSAAVPTLETSRNVWDLPYDVLFELFRYLSAVDVTALFSTCSNAHKHAQDSSIWQPFCSEYGLQSVACFGGLSFYTVYTQLLYPYGPLLGLWASDHPYRGNVIEFRLIPGDEHEQGGIIGEVWRHHQVVSQYPLHPEYVRALKIGFDAPFVPSPTPLVEGGYSFSQVVAPKARISCSTVPPIDDAHWHSTYLEVIPPNRYGYFMQGHRRPFPHPDFPETDAAWYDTQRCYPRLRMSIPVLVDQRELVRIYPAVRLPIIFASKTAHTKPAGISIHCSGGDDRCTQMYQPALPFDNLSTALPRYYPLRRDIRNGVEPMNANFAVETLTGLWLGTFGLYGTELLHLTWYRMKQCLWAFKITGDANVPRGAPLWTLFASPVIPPSPVTPSAAWTGELPNGCPKYIGCGTVSERGYPYVQLSFNMLALLLTSSQLQASHVCPTGHRRGGRGRDPRMVGKCDERAEDLHSL